MSASFFDSNVLLYSASTDERRADIADHLIAGRGTISVQVLNEVASVARRKMGLQWSELYRLLDNFRYYLNVIDVSDAIHQHGLRLAERYGFAIYDAMIVAAAIAAGCDTLWSEDMHDGLLVDDRLTIRNPFAG